MIETVLMALSCAALAQAEPRPPAAAPGELVRSSTTITGQRLELPGPDVEVIVTAVELPAGGAIPPHKHPWPRYAYVERGRLRVHYEAAGLVREFGPGEALVEAVDQWHRAEVVGADPVRIIVIDHVPPGRMNVVRR